MGKASGNYERSAMFGDNISLVQSLLEKHGYVLEELLPSLTSESVVKVKNPRGAVKWGDKEVIDPEYACLLAWSDLGYSPKVRRLSPNAFWIEWIDGTSLIKSNQMKGQVKEVGQIARKLHVGAPDNAPRLIDAVTRRQKLIEKNSLIPLPLIQRSCQLYEELSSSNEKSLLHGDLHGGNIIKKENSLKVFDPYGYRGEQAYDLAFYAASIPGFKFKDLEELVAGYGEEPPRLNSWLKWILIYKYDVATRKCPKDTPLAVENLQTVFGENIFPA